MAIYKPGTMDPQKPNKPMKAKPYRGTLHEQMPDYSEYKSTSYNRRGPFVNAGKLPPKRPWTKMVKKGY